MEFNRSYSSVLVFLAFTLGATSATVGSALWIRQCGNEEQGFNDGITPVVKDGQYGEVDCYHFEASDTVYWMRRNYSSYNPGPAFDYVATCPPNEPCTTDFPDLYNVTRESTSSIFTIKSVDRRNYLSTGEFACRTQDSGTRSNACYFSNYWPAEVDECCASLDRERNQMTGGCFISKAYGKDYMFRCDWYEQRGNFPETQVKHDVIDRYSPRRHLFTENGMTYYSFTCNFTRHVPDADLKYHYRVEVGPGSLSPPVPITDKCRFSPNYSPPSTTTSTTTTTTSAPFKPANTTSAAGGSSTDCAAIVAAAKAAAAQAAAASVAANAAAAEAQAAATEAAAAAKAAEAAFAVAGLGN